MSDNEFIEVYRIEHTETRTGPYNTWGITIDQMVADHDNSLSEHPNPFNDGLADLDSFVHFFGFERREQVNEWFEDKYLSVLDQAGFVLSTYTVQKRYVLLGGRQLAFEKDYAGLVNEERLINTLQENQCSLTSS